MYQNTKGLYRAALMGATLLVAFAASAQEGPIRPTPLPAYGRSVVGNEDSTTITQNPANLTYLPAAELRWTGVFLDESAEVLQQGHAVGLAFSGPDLPIGLGARMDWVHPPHAASQMAFARDARYQLLTLGLALGGSGASLGVSWQRSFSNVALAHGLSAWTAALSSRPSNYAGFALLAKNFNEPESEADLRLDRSYVLALAIRPLGSRDVELGLEGEYLTFGDGYWIPRATLGVDIPYVGRVRGEFSVNDPGEQELEKRSYLGAINLAFWGNAMGGSVELGGGAAFGNGLGASAGRRATNLHGELAFRGWREPTGAEAADYALRIRLDETPDPREHVALLRRLWEVAEHESAIRAVVLELKAAPALSFAHVEELRDAVGYLQQHGKRVLCHMESGDSSALYLCSAADRILVTRAGGIQFAGLRMRYLHLKELLDNLHIRADFIRIGEHKSAPEQFTRQSASPANRADRIDLLQQMDVAFTSAVAGDRHLTPAQFRERIAEGPFSAEDAQKAGLVDGVAYQDELEQQVQTLTGLQIPLLDDQRALVASKYFGPQRKLAIVYIDRGELIDGRSRTYPFVDMEVVGSHTIVETLKQVREDPSVGAVVLRIESPGGSSLAADVIWRAVEQTNQVKPVVVSMGGLAASGGYYIAVPTRRIFANRSTITGSIGVYYGKADASELLKRIGVNIEVYKTTPHADADAFYRPFTEEERVSFRDKLSDFYDLFLSRVADGRHLQKASVDAVAQGRVWTGAQASTRGLVDEVGGLRQAIRYARELGGLADYAPIVELPEKEQSLIGKLLGVEGIRASRLAAMPPELVEIARALAPFSIYSSQQPLMRLELVPMSE